MNITEIRKRTDNELEDYSRRKFPFVSILRNNEQSPIFGANNQFLAPEQAPAQPQQQPQSRFAPKFMEMTQPVPVLDTEEIQTQQGRARTSVLGQLLGSLGQLGGMAAGGDAVQLDNSVPSIALNQILTMDKDYRDRLGQYWKDSFDTNKTNIGIQNRFLGDEADRAFRDDQRGKGEQFRTGERLGEEKFRTGLQDDQQKFLSGQQAARLKADINKLYIQDKLAFNEEMRKAGVNPNDKDAVDQYLSKMNMKTTKSGGGSGKPYDVTDPAFIEAVRRGREIELERINNQLNTELSRPDYTNPDGQKQRIDELREKKKRYETMKVETGNQEAVDAYEIGIREGALDRSQTPPMAQPFQPPAPPQGNEQNLDKIKSDIQNNIQMIYDGDDSKLLETLKLLVQTGIVKNEEEAEKYLILLLEGI